MRKRTERDRSVHVKRAFNFRKGEVVEWTDWHSGVKTLHEGEIIGNGGIYKHIRIGSDANAGDIKVTHRRRADYYTIQDFANGETKIVHGSRLTRCKVKVMFS